MRYQQAKAQGLPIAFSVVEAACKTLATQRMKQSAMKWDRKEAKPFSPWGEPKAGIASTVGGCSWLPPTRQW